MTRARYVHCDVTREDDWAGARRRDASGVDVLVNNAAILHLSAIADTSVETVRRVFEVNELGTFLGIKAVIAPMRAGGGGSIVNISSIDGVFVTPGTAAYAASKFAVRGLTKTAALELGRFGIRVNAVCPAAGQRRDGGRRAAARLRLQRGQRAAAARPRTARRSAAAVRWRDVADAVVFFASDESAFVTGADLLVDGGMSAGMIIPGQPGT